MEGRQLLVDEGVGGEIGTDSVVVVKNHNISNTIEWNYLLTILRGLIIPSFSNDFYMQITNNDKTFDNQLKM